MGQKQSMEGQIDLDSYQARVERAQKNQYMKKNDEKTSLPFRLIIFQKAYIALKKDGKIRYPEILEFRKPSSYEIYESLYINTLQKVYVYCKIRSTNEYQISSLTCAYTQEFDWMVQRFHIHQK